MKAVMKAVNYFAEKVNQKCGDSGIRFTLTRSQKMYWCSLIEKLD